MRSWTIPAVVLLSVTAQAAEPERPTGIRVDKPDVRANVMRMLEQARRGETASTDGVARGERPNPAPVPPPAQPAAPRPANTLSTRPDWFDGSVRGRFPDTPAEGGHVPVPHKTLIIRSYEDLDLVDSALGAGRARFQGDKPPETRDSPD